MQCSPRPAQASTTRSTTQDPVLASAVGSIACDPAQQALKAACILGTMHGGWSGTAKGIALRTELRGSMEPEMFDTPGADICIHNSANIVWYPN